MQPIQKSLSHSDNFIIAIGASAGGLEAIHEFFDHMPESRNVSFIIIQHLSPDYKSLLVDLVSRHTHMQVFEAEDNVDIEPDCVYVIPNNKLITVKKNKLVLAEKKIAHTPNNAIDVFLYSLAAEKKDRAIAVILSGTGSDGTKGGEAIKKAGGLLIVQDPATARFDGMPNSAINSGNADSVLPPSEMPAHIISYLNSGDANTVPEFDISDKMLDEIFILIHKEIGKDFTYYKTPTIIRRINRRIVQGNFTTPEKYLDELRHNPAECRLLGKDFLIGVTKFFRDADAFACIKDIVLPGLLEEKRDGDLLKIWVSACSTGEEAYSIAILVNEALEAAHKNIDVKIFATDIDEASVEVAAKATYNTGIEEHIDATLLEKYFIRENNHYTVIPRIRKQVVFAVHNILNDPPFIKNDLVTCRNMLIYMGSVLQKKVYSILLFAANRYGYLFLGPSEHPAFIKDSVRDISSKWKIYKKVANTKLDLQGLTGLYDAKNEFTTRGPRQPKAKPKKEGTLWEELKRTIDHDLNFCAFYIDKNFEIKDAAGNYERLLMLPQKKLQLNLLTMLPAETALPVSTEIKRAWKENRKIKINNIRYQKNNSSISLQIFIKPPENDPLKYTLVTIFETDAVPAGSETPAISDAVREPGTKNYLRSLEEELDETKNRLQFAVEDLETTNEELQSSNEELLSANEELQSSNEELQSLNEELHTLNTEHQLKIKELIELNDDLNNYFRSTDIGQVFLDEDLRIRKFNTASEKMINFIEKDIGRPLAHISNNIKYEALIQDATTVLKENKIIEKEAQLTSGKNILLRLMPYLSRDKEKRGVILTFVDISLITSLNNIIRGIFNASSSAIFAIIAVRNSRGAIIDFTLQTGNNSTDTLLKGKIENHAGKSLKKDLPLLLSHSLFEDYVEVVETDKSLHKDIYFEEEDRWFDISAVKMDDGCVVTFNDVTQKKVAEQKLKKNYIELITTKDELKALNAALETKIAERTRELSLTEERFRLVSRATNDALWDWNFVNNTVWWGDSFYKLFGYTRDGSVTDRYYWLEKVHPDDRKETEKSIYDSINGHIDQWQREYRFLKSDGTYANILDRAYILHDEFGTPYRMLGSMFDATELKRAQEEIANMNRLLEQKVEQRTRELLETNQALEASNNDLQQFASVASHDLQEPLRKIHMFSQLIKDKYADSLDGASVYIDKIIQSCTRMKTLTRNILNFSSLSAANSHFERTNLHNMVLNILEDFDMLISEKKAKVTVTNLPEVDVIPGQVQQVFQNLISNALKFTIAGKAPVVTITGELVAEKSFNAPEDTNGGFVRIYVKDNGIGFDEKFKENIFMLFQRLHTKDKYEGTGIGLSITKRIIDKHNGVITAHSVENEGAEFIIVLPLTQPTGN